jgi:hypothetical protein
VQNVAEEDEDNAGETVHFDFAFHDVAKQYHINDFGLEIIDHFLHKGRVTRV